jgi:AcrR family transcriptional regulator
MLGGMATDREVARKSRTKPATVQPDNSSTGSRRKQLVENEILEQATRLFAERGFKGTSLQDVADAMGLKRPALYYYFKSKDDLLDRLIVEATSGPAHDLNAIAARPDLDVAARLHAMARHIVLWVTKNRDRFLLLVKSESDLSPASAEKFNEGRRAALDAVRSVIQEGVEAGWFRPVDPQVAAFGVWGICNWVAWWYQPDGGSPPDAIADQLAEMAVAGLQRAEPGKGTVTSPRSALAVLREQLDELERALDRDHAS